MIIKRKYESTQINDFFYEKNELDTFSKWITVQDVSSAYSVFVKYLSRNLSESDSRIEDSEFEYIRKNEREYPEKKRYSILRKRRRRRSLDHDESIVKNTSSVVLYIRNIVAITTYIARGQKIRENKSKKKKKTN